MRSDGWGNTYHHRRPPALAAFGDFSGDPHSDCGGFPCRGNCPMRRLEERAERCCCHASRSTATESTWCSAAKRNGEEPSCGGIRPDSRQNSHRGPGGSMSSPSAQSNGLHPFHPVLEEVTSSRLALTSAG